MATVAQFSGADPLIYRSPLRTEQFNPKHLNAPNFVSSMHHDDHVYFFLRETAVEYINCGKTVYSRVARVCTKDRGGPHKFRNQWTSFVKARLNCSVPGDFPFYFNEIRKYSSILFLSIAFLPALRRHSAPRSSVHPSPLLSVCEVADETEAEKETAAGGKK